MREKKNIKGLTRSELRDFAESLGEKPFRGNQLFSWLYGKQASSFEQMSDISKDLQSLLHRTASVENLRITHKRISPVDGTTKFLFHLSDELMIESVLIPAEADSPGWERRLTLCLSTQVGCPLDCKFCATGSMGFTRNLSAGEIVDQALQVQHESPRRISNLVFMGMGEPMLNYDNVMKAVEILTDDWSLNIGWKHITVSTAGYADGIRRMADEGRKVRLALSLHSLDDEKRSFIMPINRKYSVQALTDALAYYYGKTQRRPTLEYILFDGFNDSERDVKRLVEFSRKVPCKINLIPFHSIEFTHPTAAASLRPAPRRRIQEFADALRNANLTVMVRSSSGEDIDAACGQLAVRERHDSAASAGTERPEYSNL